MIHLIDKNTSIVGLINQRMLCFLHGNHFYLVSKLNKHILVQWIYILSVGRHLKPGHNLKIVHGQSYA